MNIHQTKAHAQFLRSIGWEVCTHKFKKSITYYYLKKIPLLPFHFLKIQRLPKALIDWNYVQYLEKKYWVYETVVEVDETSKELLFDHQLLLNQGFRVANDFMLTTKTRLIDLSLDSQTLMKQMKPKTRYNLNKSMNNGLTVTVVPLGKIVGSHGLFTEYFDLLRDNSRRINMLLIPQKWVFLQWKAFSDNGFMVGIRDKKNKHLEAMAVFYTTADMCSYNLNGSTQKGRHDFAPSLAIFTGMMTAKKMGLKRWDFDGIYDERYDSKQKRFRGFGRFKAGFGGEEVYFPPMYRKLRWGL